MNPQVLAIAAGVALAYYAGVGIVHGVKKIGHAISSVVHHPQPPPVPVQPKDTESPSAIQNPKENP